MKAPKNFYNTVDQTKLGIDDLFTRTAENESDIAALETVVGDLDGGLVKDVHDLQDDSEHYHDDIADLKTADTLINNRIDGHLLKETTTLADEGKIMAVDSNGDWALTAPASVSNVLIIEAALTISNKTLTFNKTISELFSEIVTAIDSGKDVIIKGNYMLYGQLPLNQFYRLSSRSSTNLHFLNVSRNATSTSYIFFELSNSESGTTVTFTDKTVNDPA